MAKERDWVDYANLASNVTQNFQLRHTNQTLEGLERAATERALGEQQNRLADEHEARLREHVFQLADNVEGLQRHLHELPCAALALGIQIKGMLKKNNVTTASFRAWEDKDRLKKVVKGLDDVCEKSTARLTESQREDAEKCAKYLTERDALDQLSSIQNAKEKFERERTKLKESLNISGKQIEIEKLKVELSHVHSAPWEVWCFLLGLLGLIFSMCWFLVYISSTPPGYYVDLAEGTIATPPMNIPSGLALLIFLASLVACVLPVFSPANQRRVQLTSRIKVLEAEVASATAELNQFDSKSPIRQNPAELCNDPTTRDFMRRIEAIAIQRGDLSQEWVTQARLEELYAMFGGDLPSEAYEQMKREWEAFINKIFGKSDATAIAS